MADVIKLENGKYTVVNALSEGGGFHALRYGEEWRDLAGDNLVYAMFSEIERLREIVSEITCVGCGEEVSESWELVRGTPYCDICAEEVKEEVDLLDEN